MKQETCLQVARSFGRNYRRCKLQSDPANRCLADLYLEPGSIAYRNDREAIARWFEKEREQLASDSYIDLDSLTDDVCSKRIDLRGDYEE